MSNDMPKVDEIYSANNQEKKFSLLPAFDKFAQSKWYNEKVILQAKAEISRRFAQFNTEGMNDQRFKILSRTISNMIESELSRAKSKLQEQSGAMVGVDLPPKSGNISSILPPNVGTSKTEPIGLQGTLGRIKARNEMLASL